MQVLCASRSAHAEWLVSLPSVVPVHSFNAPFPILVSRRVPHRLATVCLGLVTLTLALWFTVPPPAIGEMLVPPLEQRFPRTAIGDPATIAGVIALGGSDDRVREACRLSSLYPHLRVFVSGHGEQALVRTGLGTRYDACRFELENASHNTRTNATFTRGALNPAPSERWLLVTSAAHMPRSIGAFRKAGMAVEPWPIYDQSRETSTLLTVARHEWLGLLAYWLMGHSSELFPAPPEPAAASIGAADQAPAFAPI